MDIHQKPEKPEKPCIDQEYIRYFRIGYHVCISGTYLYSIIFQFEKASYHGFFLNILKWLTFQCQIIQLGTYGLCLISNFDNRFIAPRDLLFTTLGYPISQIVFMIFWPVFIYDRELILKKSLELSGEFPAYMNHINHSLIIFANLFEFFLVDHKQASNKQALVLLGSFVAEYTITSLVYRAVTGNFVYEFMNKFTGVQAVGFISGSILMTGLCYFTGSYINRRFSKLREKYLGRDDDYETTP